MGTIRNEFVVIELHNGDIDAHLKAQELVTASKLPSFISHGANNSTFISIHPSGSKMGWAKHKDHKEQIDRLVEDIEGLADFTVVNKVTTVDESCY